MVVSINSSRLIGHFVLPEVSHAKTGRQCT